MNAYIDRLYTGESMRGGRSHCDSCQHPLGVFDLIPLFSWFFLKGRCRYCREFISPQNPLVELGTGVLFILSYLVSFQLLPVEIFMGQRWLIVLYFMLVSAALLVIFVYDWKHQIIPDQLVLFLVILTVIFHGLYLVLTQETIWQASILNLLASGFFSFLPYFLLILVTNGKGMGGGDMKLALAMGLILGFPRIIVAHYTAFLLGGLLASVLLLIKRKQFGEALAFGPFLVIGTIIAMFIGETVMEWYVQFMYST